MAHGQEGLDDVGADEAATPGDQDPHYGPAIWATLDGVIDVILPVLDERVALPGVLGSLPEGYRPIVVDNGSADGSGELAAHLGAQVVEELRRGFGAACFAGLMAARADVVCFMDCDGSLDGSDLPRVTAPLLDRRADLVLGRRRARPGSWPIHARLANRAVGAALRIRHGVGLRDLGPMRAGGRQALLELGIVDLRFGWPLEMVVRAAGSGWRIEEVDVTYHPRQGRSKVTGTLSGTVKTVRDMASILR
jgi:glycosyltransferase involved in cell wall biosynthesis